MALYTIYTSSGRASRERTADSINAKFVPDLRKKHWTHLNIGERTFGCFEYGQDWTDDVEIYRER